MTSGSLAELTRARHSSDLGGDPVLDASVLTDLLDLAGDDDPDFLSEVIETFLEDSQVRIQALSRDAQEGHLDRAAGSAHALKSASASVGALVLSEGCAEFEDAIRARHEFDALAQSQRLASLLREVQQVLGDLQTCLQGEPR